MRCKGKIPNGKPEENFDVTQITKYVLELGVQIAECKKRNY